MTGNRAARGASAGRWVADQGSVTVVAAAVMVIVLVMTFAAVDVMKALRASSRAQTAADAAALAAAQAQAEPGVEDPAAAARDYAEANGGELLECRCPAGGREAIVTVRVQMGPFLILPGSGAASATARAVVDEPPG